MQLGLTLTPVSRMISTSFRRRPYPPLHLSLLLLLSFASSCCPLVLSCHHDGQFTYNEPSAGFILVIVEEQLDLCLP